MTRASGVVSTAREQVHTWTILGESETQEFKIGTGQHSEAAKTLCAFLNLKGGRILFDVDTVQLTQLSARKLQITH